MSRLIFLSFQGKIHILCNRFLKARHYRLTCLAGFHRCDIINSLIHKMSFCQRDCTFLLWRQVATCLLRSNIENRHNGNILKRHYCLSSFSKDRVKSLLLSDKHQKDKKQRLTCGRLFSTCMRNNVISNIYQKQIDKLLLPCFGGPHGCLELNRLKTFRRTLSTNTTDFSLRNPLMKNYLDSLIEEYEEIMEEVAQGDKSNKKRSSRMIQLHPVAELIQTLKTKYQEMEELTNLQAGNKFILF